MMFVSYAETVEDFRAEVVAILRQEADRRAGMHARTKTERLTISVRENELRNQASFFEAIKFFPRKQEERRS